MYVIYIHHLQGAALLKQIGPAQHKNNPTRGFWREVFLKEYTPSGFGGLGLLGTTRSVSEAKRYPTQDAAVAEYRAISDTHPIRHDGKPNRPLTAYTVEILTLELAEGQYGRQQNPGNDLQG